MLHEDARMIKPSDVAKQIPWDEMEYVVIIAQPKYKPETDNTAQLWLSTLTVNELGFASQQLQAHTTCIFGPMKEMPDGK